MLEVTRLAAVTWDTTWWEDAIRLFAAVVCAGVVGWDRESRGHAAGLRTHMMVSLGAAAFGLIACALFEALDAQNIASGADPIRVLAAVVGGVGFLGAGAIMQSGEKVKGLTTAAGLWVVAGIGLACGVGYYTLAVLVTAAAVLTLSFMKRAERHAKSE